MDAKSCYVGDEFFEEIAAEKRREDEQIEGKTELNIYIYIYNYS